MCKSLWIQWWLTVFWNLRKEKKHIIYIKSYSCFKNEDSNTWTSIQRQYLRLGSIGSITITKHGRALKKIKKDVF